VIKKYRCSQTFGDRYAGEWVVEGFRKFGIHYEECEQTRTELYLNTVPLINSRSVALLDSEGLMLQLVSLERKTSSVKDRVDHPVGMHDDLGERMCRSRRHGPIRFELFSATSVENNLKLNAVYKKWARSVA